MKIIVDTREKAPFRFDGKLYDGVVVEAGTLATGDYALAGLEDRAAIERKSLDDLIMCLGKERGRFERELLRARGLAMFAVIVEDTWQALAAGSYKSAFNPHAACQSVAAFMARLGIPFIFAGSRAAAEYIAWSLLRQWLAGEKKRLDALIKAHGAACQE